MPKPQKTDSIMEGAEKAAAALAGFDYNVDAEDFVLYELHRLIEEGRASFGRRLPSNLAPWCCALSAPSKTSPRTFQT
jgi:hypothetical protein